LLIALALQPAHVVPKATLIDWIWGEQLPSEATNALQRLVSRLRKALPDGLVEERADGYRLMVDPDVVDAVRFERLVGQARHDEGPRRVQLRARPSHCGAVRPCRTGSHTTSCSGARCASLFKPAAESGFEVAHGVGRVGQLVGPVDHGSEPTGFDEFGETFDVDAGFFGIPMVSR
jgi:Transcriptional regulatory protein, C terminal